MKKGSGKQKIAIFTSIMLVIYGIFLIGCSENLSTSQESKKEHSVVGDDKAFLSYLEKGDVPRVKEFLESGISPNIKNASLQTPLMIAVNKGNLELVRLLLAKNANIEVEHKLDGKTALMIAVNNNKKEIVQALLENGANINHKDVYGENAISIAQQKGLKDIAQILKIMNSKKNTTPLLEVKQYQSKLHDRVVEITKSIENFDKILKTKTITPSWLQEAQGEMDIISANITDLSQLTTPNGYMRIDDYIKKAFDCFSYAQKSLERIIVVKDQSSKQDFLQKLEEGKGFLHKAEGELN